MNWYTVFNRKISAYDLILREPLVLSSLTYISLVESFNSIECKLEVSFSKLKNKDFGSLVVYSMLRDFSHDGKIYFERLKGVSGKKVYKLSSKLINYSSSFFVDFFLHLIIRGLKRRYIVLKTSQSLTGVLNLRFSSMSELEIDDYFFFDLDEWSGFLNIFFKPSVNPKLLLSFGLFFRYAFNLNKLLKYEVFGRKG